MGLLVTEPPGVCSSGTAAGLGQAARGPRAAPGEQRPARPLLRASPARAPQRSGLRTADQASGGDTPARGSAASRPGPAAIGCGSPGPAPGAAAGVAECRCHLGRAAARGGGWRRERWPSPARRDTFSKCCCPEFAFPKAGRAQPARLRRRARRGAGAVSNFMPRAVPGGSAPLSLPQWRRRRGSPRGRRGRAGLSLSAQATSMGEGPGPGAAVRG